MKKIIPIIFLFIFSILVIQSCTDEPAPKTQVIENTSNSRSVKGRTISEAAELAKEALGMLNDKDSRASARSFSPNNVQFCINHVSRSNSTDTLFYVFNFDNEAGFAIIAYNKNIPGIIAVTELGSYNPDQESENKNFEFYIQATKQLLAEYNADNITIKPTDSMKIIDTTIITEDVDDPVNPELVQYKFEKRDVLKEKIEPNYNLRWGQTNPEGLLFENGLCGCTNTAMIIIMSYFNYPNQISLTYPNASQSSLNLDWIQIKNHHQSGSYSNYDLCTEQTHNSISMLCKQLAYLNGSHCYFKPDTVTETIVNREKPTFKNLGFKVSDNLSYNSNVILSVLKYSNAIFFINGVNLKTGGGHAFVIDGLDYYDYWSGEYIKRYGEDWELVNDHGITQNRYNHINWGWNGVCNGYFSSQTIDALKCGNYDPYCKPVIKDEYKNDFQYSISSMYYVYR